MENASPQSFCGLVLCTIKTSRINSLLINKTTVFESLPVVLPAPQTGSRPVWYFPCLSLSRLIIIHFFFIASLRKQMIILFHNLLSTVMTGNIFQIFRRMTIFSCIHLSVIPGFFACSIVIFSRQTDSGTACNTASGQKILFSMQPYP